jgi:parvulin-like peptidyl-prolyl isomerase
MKKLAILMMCVGLLTACSSGYSVNVDDGDSTLVSGDGITVTKQEYFEYLLDNYGASQIVSDALEAIADKEVTDEKEINSLLKEREETYASYSNGDLSAYAKSLGYSSKDDYINKALLPDVKQELLRKKYIKENLDTMLTDYQVSCFKKIIVEKESTALAIIKASTSEKAFDKQMKKYSSDAEDAGIVTKNTTLDENLTKKLETFNKVTKDGIYKDAVKLSDDTYAVIYIYDTARKNTDDYISALSSDSDIQEAIEGIYLKKYNFTVNDSKLKDAIKEISDQYIE